MIEQPQNESSLTVQKEPGIFGRLKDSLNFKKMSRGQALYTIAFIAIVGIMVFLYAYTFLVDETFLSLVIITLFVIPVVSIGLWGIPLYYGIMLLQCVVAPIPSELVQIVGGLIFGLGWGFVFSLTGIMITSFIGYSIAIKGGAHVIGAAIGDKNVKLLEHFINKYGIWAMILGRGIPFVPFDLLTYGAGLVKMQKRDFVIGTFIGTVPRSIFYSFIGASLFPGGASDIASTWNTAAFDTKLAEVSAPFNFWFTLTIVVVVAGFAVVQFIIMPYMRRKAAKEAKQLPPQTTG